MQKKVLRSIIIFSAWIIILSACSLQKQNSHIEKNQTNAESTDFSGDASNHENYFSFETYFEMDDDTVLVEVNNEQLTVGDVKKKAFMYSLIGEVHRFVESEALYSLYPVSNEELTEELKFYDDKPDVDAEKIRFDIAFEKAIQDIPVEFTEEEIQKHYEETALAESGTPLEEVLDDILHAMTYNENAPKVYKMIAHQYKELQPVFIDELLEREVNRSNVDWIWHSTENEEQAMEQISEFLGEENNDGLMEEPLIDAEIFSPESYYEMNDDTILVEINGNKLTIDDVKRKLFADHLLWIIEEFIHTQTLFNLYPVTDEEVWERVGEYQEESDFDLEGTREALARDKAYLDGIDISEEEIEEKYNEFYKDLDIPLEEVRDDLIKTIAYEKRSFEEIHEIIERHSEELEITFVDQSLLNKYQQYIEYYRSN